MSQNPFPGPQPYRATDRSRFHGRDEMAQQLGGSILAHRCITVFGPSGAGKSSLMQAAIIPHLMEKHAFRTVRIDSWPDDVTATSWLRNSMLDGLKLGTKPVDMAPADMVIAVAQRAARRSERPFLVYLDQMEQLLYDSRNPTELDEFAECIHRLAELPIRGFKLVLSLREDYLGRFRDRLRGRLRLLDHGFRVGPLRVGELADAMCKVAATGQPPQIWSLDEIRRLMMQVRTAGQAESDEAEAQAAYAQIVCRALWDQRDAAKGRIATSQVFEAEDILQQYMETTLLKLGALREEARQLLEDHLITKDGSRTLRTEKELRGELSAEALETILQSLEGAAILRAEERQGQRYFELGHDWLAKNLLEQIKQRQEEAEKQKREAEERAKEQSHQKERRKLRRVVFALAALAVGLVVFVVAIPIFRSYVNNRALVRETQQVIRLSESDWTDGGPPELKLDKLDPLLGRLEEFDRHERDGVPAELRWGMYRGKTIGREALVKYVDIMQKACIAPVRQRLESRVQGINGKNYLSGRNTLRVYLMLEDVEHLDIDEQAYRRAEIEHTDLAAIDGTQVKAITTLWAGLYAAVSNSPAEELEARMRPHVRYYLRLLKSKRVAPLLGQTTSVDAARKVLQGVPLKARYYDLFVHDAVDQTFAPEKLRYPPLTLSDLYHDRPEVLTVMTSSAVLRDGRFKQIEPPYTNKGHNRVLMNINDAASVIERERWIVGGDGLAAEDVPLHVKTLAADYEQRCIEQWDAWMTDIEVRSPANVEEATTLYGVLLRPPYPYLQILRGLEDHTQWNRTKRAEAQHGQMIDRWFIDGRPSIVPKTFASTIAFGIPTQGANAEETPLKKYHDLLTELRRDLQALQDGSPGGRVNPGLVSKRLNVVRQSVEALLAPFDERARRLLTPLLMNPLRLTNTKVVNEPRPLPLPIRGPREPAPG